MKRDLIHLYRAPGTRARLELATVSFETDEVREGFLRCTVSGRQFAIHNGAAVLIDPVHMSPPMLRDQEMIELADRNVDAMVAHDSLPDFIKNSSEAYGRGLKANTDVVFSLLEHAPKGKILLEIGAGDSKLSAHFTKLGFHVVALDFAGYRLCSTADRYIPESGYFERVVGLMADLPFPDNLFDVVFMHATLHHAVPLDHAKFKWCEPANMAESLSEIGRVLKSRTDGGLFILAGEGVYPENTPIEARHYEKVAKNSGFYESWYEMSEYEAQFKATNVWPNLWTNQESFNTFVYGYLPDGTRFDVIKPGDGINSETGSFFLARARRLNEVIPSWAMSRPLFGESGIIGVDTANQVLIIESLVQSAYRGVLKREAEPRGIEIYGNALRAGMPLADLIAELIRTPEFQDKGKTNETTVTTVLPYKERRLALAFIVKDEGLYALQMLKSVATLVGFVSCVDTGSSDKSVSLVSDYLKSIQMPYQISCAAFRRFDESRNMSIKAVPNSFEWILILDCDEALHSGCHEHLHKVMNDNSNDAWYIPRFNWLDRVWGECQANYPDYQGRLFKYNQKNEIFFSGDIHEELDGYQSAGFTSSLPAPGATETNLIHIHHLKFILKPMHEIKNRDAFYDGYQANKIQSKIPLL